MQEKSITHIWLRFDRRWLLAGAVSGIGAGLLVLLVTCVASAQVLGEWSQPLKFIGAAMFGGVATAYGPVGVAGFAGLFLHLGLSTLYGVTFAQLVDEKSRLVSLVVLGLVTSFIIWIFGCKLFMPSFNPFLALTLPARVGLILHLFFGASFGFLLDRVRPIFLKLL